MRQAWRRAIANLCCSGRESGATLPQFRDCLADEAVRHRAVANRRRLGPRCGTGPPRLTTGIAGASRSRNLHGFLHRVRFRGFELISRTHWPISSRFQPPMSLGLLHELLHGPSLEKAVAVTLSANAASTTPAAEHARAMTRLPRSMFVARASELAAEARARCQPSTVSGRGPPR
jgi:hypothetical protein